MAGKIWRAAIVGATGLLGKEMADELNSAEGAVWDLTLLDKTEPDAAGGFGGQITSAGDEAMMVLPLTAEAFAGMDVVFFAGDAATTQEFWSPAHKAGAGVVDLTGALESVPGVVVGSPWIASGKVVDLATVAVVAAYPAAVMLALTADRLQRAFGVQRLAATVLEPASQQGSAGVDEMHQQTVALLTFKPVTKELYDAQVAFSLQTELGGAAKLDLRGVGDRTLRQVQAMAGDAAKAVTLQIVQAPVFHGATASVFVELAQPVETSAVQAALSDGVMVAADEDGPSNDRVAGSREIQFAVRASGDNPGTGFWLWMAADNLRLAARQAAACAAELVALRPTSGVN
jgi:aspartate-semialdehyde dehydrogenase